MAISAATKDDASTRVDHVRRDPPIPLDVFEASMASKTFTNGADAAVVVQLYRRCLETGFGEATALSYPRCSWVDDDLAMVCSVIRSHVCPRVTLLKLTCNHMTHLDALGAAIDAGALPALEVLVLAACGELRRLPSALDKLRNLHTLILSDCKALERLPALSGLPALQLLDIQGTGMRRCEDGSTEYTSGFVPDEAALRRRHVRIVRKELDKKANKHRARKSRLPPPRRNL